MLQENNRIELIDELRGCCMLFIFLTHIFAVSGAGANPVMRWFSSFAVMLFFYISGYLMYTGHSEETAPKVFIGKRIKRILWPYVTFSAAAIIIRLVLLYAQGSSFQMLKAESAELLKSFILFSGTGALWFLPASCFASIITFFCRRGKYKTVYTVLLLLVSLIIMYKWTGISSQSDSGLTMMILVLTRSVVAAGFMILPYIVTAAGDKLVKAADSRVKRAIAGILFLCVTVLISQTVGLDFRLLQFGGLIFLLPVNVVLSFYGLRSILQLISLPCFRLIGRNSVIALGTHLEWFLVTIVWTGTAGIFGITGTWGLKLVFGYIAALILLVLIEISLIRAINTYAPWMVSIDSTGKKDR